MSSKAAKILSIQSHVVYGYVGNRCAAYTLQLLGLEVDTINTVQLSNHTGYKCVKGQVLNEKDLDELVQGLEENGLDDYTHLLTGYIGSASFLKRIAEITHQLKKKNPNLVYVCDPVMGDNGQMYVPESFTEIYRNEIVPIADVITPNQYELELLTGLSVKTAEDVKIGMRELQKMGPKIVAVSSAIIEGKLTAFVDSAIDNQVLTMEISSIPLSFTGSGDLFAALFLAYMHLESDVKAVLEKTINTVQCVLLKTFEHHQANLKSNAQEAQKKELRLIQSRDLILNPVMKLRAMEC